LRRSSDSASRLGSDAINKALFAEYSFRVAAYSFKVAVISFFDTDSLKYEVIVFHLIPRIAAL
jgi:hypothetical protein